MMAVNNSMQVATGSQHLHNAVNKAGIAEILKWLM
jgi:hypothetical protein